MKYLILILYSTHLLADQPVLAPFPVFLRQGFSSVLEFEAAPSRVVLGDSQLFQIEKLDRSLVLKTLAPYATTNMFVYFSGEKPRVFILTASEEAEPTFYRKFESIVIPSPIDKASVHKSASAKRGIRIIDTSFDRKKDFLTVDFEVAADSSAAIRPSWELVRLINGSQNLAPMKAWSSRKEGQKDSKVRARLIFAKPNLARNLKGVVLVLPLDGEKLPLKVTL